MTPSARLDKRDFQAQYTGELPEAADNAGKNTLETAERANIEMALARSGGNLSRAASMLGISRQSLYRRMEKYGIRL